MLPQHMAVRVVEAEDALFSCERAALIEAAFRRLVSLGQDPIGQVDPAVRHRWSGVAAADFRAPAHGRPAFGKFVEEARFAPDAIALRPEPLRPIVGTGRRRRGNDGEAKAEAAMITTPT